MKIVRNGFWVAAIVLATTLSGEAAMAQTLTFDLLTWDDGQATGPLPSAVGVKPSPSLPAASDWLVFTADDAPLAAADNPAGAVSHNLVDLAGGGGSGFNLAASLSGAGAITMDFTSTGPDEWQTSVTGLSYSGQALSSILMNQFLVEPGSPATQNPSYNVDGVGNGGTWQGSEADDWALTLSLDFYLATDVDFDGSPSDIDATFDDTAHVGFMIPVDRLTPAGMAAVDLDDPAGFYAGDFEQYLLDEIAPRLPNDATFLLVTQMAKVNPDFTDAGLPITTSTLVGNTTFAYTTQTLHTPSVPSLGIWGLVILPICLSLVAMSRSGLVRSEA